jgi:hypothetical protein
MLTKACQAFFCVIYRNNWFFGSRVPDAAQINKKPAFLWLPELPGLWNCPETIESLDVPSYLGDIAQDEEPIFCQIYCSTQTPGHQTD